MSVRSHLKQTKEFASAADQAVVSLLVAAGLLNQGFNDVCRRYGITHDQYNILRILRGVHPEGHPRYEIANRLIRRAPDVTRLIDRLERQGLVERGWSATNRRHSIARITAAGLQLLEDIKPELLAVEQDAVAELSTAELRELSRICDRMAR